MRFSIRDLLWATLVVAMGLGWWMSYRALDAKRLEAVGQSHRQRAALNKAVMLQYSLVNDYGYVWKTPEHLEFDPTILDEPLVEP